MSAPTKTQTHLTQELLDLEKKNWEAWKTRDAKTLESLMVMDEGISEQSKSDFVAMMLEGEMTLKSYKLYEDSVLARQLSPGVAFIAYKARPEMDQNGTTLATDYFFLTTFVRKGDRWVSAVGAASKAGSPK